MDRWRGEGDGGEDAAGSERGKRTRADTQVRPYKDTEGNGGGEKRRRGRRREREEMEMGEEKNSGMIYNSIMREFIPSRNAVYETLRAKRRQFFQLEVAEGAQEKGRLAEILQMAGERKIPVVRAPRGRMDKVNAGHQGVLLEASGYPYINLEDILELARRKAEAPFVLMLDTLNDPQNFGTLLRTAEAVGAHGVVLPLARTVGVTPAVVNASSGASEHLLIAQANLSQAIDLLREASVWTVGLDEQGEAFEAGQEKQLQGGLALVVGSEGEGIRPLVRSKCDFLLRLPMVGRIESLNAAVAGSVALYLAYLARRKEK